MGRTLRPDSWRAWDAERFCSQLNIHACKAISDGVSGLEEYLKPAKLTVELSLSDRKSAVGLEERNYALEYPRLWPGENVLGLSLAVLAACYKANKELAAELNSAAAAGPGAMWWWLPRIPPSHSSCARLQGMGAAARCS